MSHPRPPLPLVSLLVSFAGLGAALELLRGGAIVIAPHWLGPFGAVRLSAQGGVAGTFELLAALVGLAASIAGRRAGLDRLGSLLVVLFIAGLVLVPLAGDVFSFLLAWELMSASPGVLIALDPDPAKRKAGLLYLVYSQLSTLALLAGLILWMPGADGSFAALTAAPLPLGAGVLLLAACLVKAGVMPFHAWLPEAHPAAPSHVSALMSGAMVAMPAYVAVRFLLPDGLTLALATIVLLLGALSSALATLHAFHARDVKRVLAMTTVAHMGTLFTLVGLGLALQSSGHPEALPAVVAAIAGYALAHGLAKGALFLVAGEVHHATGRLDLEELGGLWRSLGPLAVVAGLAAIALAGLPPFGGFPAEIAALLAIFGSLPVLDPLGGVVLLGALFLVGVGTAAGLAAVLKVVLGAFHGPVRGAAEVHRLPPGALVAPGLLLAGSLVLGIAPGLVWRRLPGGAAGIWELPTPLGAVPTAPVAAAVVVLLLVVASLAATARRPTPAPPWNCGAPPPAVRHTYTPQGLVMPWRILFAEILRPASDLRLQDAPVAPFAPSRGRYEDPAPRYVEAMLHEPVVRAVGPWMERLRLLHRGPVQTYLTIALLVLVGLLFLLPVIP